ncbi:AAA family ATPase [Pseudanabaena sp. FACHB-1277]|uniref:AAA family ATPase n=1 Tax=Pseudanabaena cinerea FACHB-1277 TaxID=2949581 RepID=A0A926Z6M3_9CYAN|nr:AAA family ATPase [Pseudanabaena cinerea]MBD2151311.1 AAA family ATPase [Pseudanabaena cinerea FACHB-1277]
MHLQRVQVPDFRVLKDVDITFEKDFNPRVFPLGSQNGGGKSTLLQLVFILLYCSANSDSLLALKNLLHGFNLPKDEDKRILAIIDIWDNQNTVKLEFFVCKDYVVQQASNTAEREIEEIRTKFSVFTESKTFQNELNNLSNKLKLLQESIKKIDSNYPELLNPQASYAPIDSEPDDSTKSLLIEMLRAQLWELDIFLEIEDMDKLSSELNFKLEQAKSNLIKSQRTTDFKIKELNAEIDLLKAKLRKDNIIYISDYIATDNSSDNLALLCNVKDLRIDSAHQFFNQLSNRIFLAAPSTQVFLFLSKPSRRSLFLDRDKYYSLLSKSNNKLPGLFTYDFLAVDLLIEYFKTARDQDFRQALETGEYGNNYQNVLKDLRLLLQDKKVNLRSDFSGLTFTKEIYGKTVELEPEDLSHGELKRLSIYVWIKHNNIKDAIVLMDEVDLALHPDWQYQIVSDLLEWEPSNQYILATHSYELCNALTPSHVKILEPKLTERRSD